LIVSSNGVSDSGILNYLWSIYSVVTGELIGDIQMNKSAMPFSIVEGNLLLASAPFGHRVNGAWVDEPPKLRLLDLTSGAEIWSKPIRDTLYRGPVPSSKRSQ